MTNPNLENENQNTLYAWATGKISMFAIGLAVGIFLYKSGVIQTITGKIFKKKED
jgi:phosphate/sulfate permease